MSDDELTSQRSRTPSHQRPLVLPRMYFYILEFLIFFDKKSFLFGTKPEAL